LSKETPSELVAYRYREKFGLSYNDFVKEPLDVLLVNLKIMSLEAEYSEGEAKRAEWRAKHGSK